MLMSEDCKLDISQQKVNLQDHINTYSKTRMKQIKGVPKSFLQKHKSIVQSGYSTVLSEDMTEKPAH